MNFLQVLVVLGVILLAKDLERWEREAPLLFTVFLFGEAGIFTAVRRESLQSYSCNQLGRCVELPRGGSDRGQGGSRTLIVDGEKRKFNLFFHMRLENHFPDWNERIDYQLERQKL